MIGFVQLRKCTEVILVLCFFMFCLAMIGISPRTAFADAQCKIILSIDRSGSISDSQWQQMGVQVQNLLRTGITGIPNLSIAMWTFSHGDPTDNYNAPHGTDYIQASALGDPVQQDTLINKIFFGTNSTSPPNFGTGHPPFLVREGGTDYQQAFGYSTDPNTGATSSNPSVRSIINGNPDGFVLITDGAPNYPGGIDGASGLNNNSAALNAAQTARGQYSVPAYGAYVTDPSSPAPDLTGLNYTMNGPSDAVGPVAYGNIEAFLEAKIADACGTVPPASYSLTPSVNPSLGQGGDAITDDTPPRFDYIVNNDGDTTTTDWQIYDIQMDPGVTIPGSQCISSACGMNVANACSYLQSLNPAIQCSQSQDDNNTTPNSGINKQVAKPSAEIYSNRQAKVDNIASLRPGTRICRGLQVSRPTQTGVPPYRLSVYCLVIAKAPLLQIQGGDVRVGRSFHDDTTTYSDSGIYMNSYTLKGTDVPNGLTFGSWVEYGALAPGRILSIASLAGYKGGATPSAVACGNVSGGGAISMTNILTFANYNSNTSDNNNECGHFPPGGVGTIPDVVSAVKNFMTHTLIDSPFQLPNSASAVYDYGDAVPKSGPLTINASTIPSTGTYVIYAPKNTVEIAGDIKFTPGGKYGGAQLKDIPQLIIIAKNISVKSSVKRIDAWLIANATSVNNGIVNTCSDIKVDDPDLCSGQLVVNGPIMARQLQPWRTTVYKGVCKLEGNYNGPFGCVGSTTNPVDKPGEIFNLPGASILWAINQIGSSRAQTTYTIELPPYY